jgi:hypothetical protein
MKILPFPAGILLLSALPLAYGGTIPEQRDRPCYRVTIQNDPVNASDVRQSCDRNVSRTVQVGNQNRAQTVQTGRVNNNGVRQYDFDRSRYFGRLRRD